MRRVTASAVATAVVALVIIACADRAGQAPPPAFAPASIESRPSGNDPSPPPGTPPVVSKSWAGSANTPAATQDASAPVPAELPPTKRREGVCEPPR